MSDKIHALKLNPILNKELRLGSRSIKIPLFVMGYDIVLASIAVTTMFIIQMSSGYNGESFSNYLYLYQIIGWTQFAITLIIVPILTAGTISGERERQTLDILLTTPKKPLSIIWGKMLSAISNYMIFVISSIPIMSIAFVLGGLNWFALLGYIAMMLVLALYLGAIGMFCSATFRRTIGSIVMTFLIAIALFSVPYMIFGGVATIAEIIHEAYYYSQYYSAAGSAQNLNLGLLPMVVLVNPAAAFFDYMMITMKVTSIHELLDQSSTFGTIMPFIAYAWIPLNLICSGGVTWFFIWAASKKLNPLKKQKKKKRKGAVPVAPEMSAIQQTMPDMTQPIPQQAAIVPDMTQPIPQQAAIVPDMTQPIPQQAAIVPDMTQPIPQQADQASTEKLTQDMLG